MARRYSSNDAVASAFVQSLENTGTYSAKTILHYREHAALVLKSVSTSLYDVTPDDVRDVALSLATAGLAVSTQKDYLHVLKALLKFIHNPAADTRIVFKADTRPSVDWLTVDQARAVLAAELPPIQELIVVLSLCMGLRRVEVARLRMSDIDLKRDCLTVTGKGRGGGKLRLVPFHIRFKPALERWLKCRARIVARSARVPDNLLIWHDRTTNRAEPYNSVKGSGMDGLYRRASQAVGVHFSAHTLRRTFARLLWLSGVPVVTIAKILGHSSTEQTLTYIGANLDDMAAAMNSFNLQ